MSSPTMTTPNINDGRARMSLADFEQDLMRRREEAGPIDMPRNSGKRRTKSKQKLIEALAKIGATW